MKSERPTSWDSEANTESEDPPVTTVDAHLHLFKALSDDYPRAVFEGMTPPEREETAERLLAAMDQAGVDKAVVVALSEQDRYLGEVLEAYPERFVGVAVHDFGVPDHVESLRRRVETMGIQGLRLYGLDAEPGSTPESIAVFPMLETMQELGIKGWFYGPPDQVEILDGCLELLPDLKIVFNHLGFLPDMEAELRIDEYGRPRFSIDLPPQGLTLVEDIARRHASVHVHFSGHYAFSGVDYPYDDLQEVADRVYRAFGADRILMASDWPWIRENPGYAETLSLVDDLLPGITSDERGMIRGGTAMSLFDFGDDV
jgi:L-fuconolactonase